MNPGTELPSLSITVTRATLVRYAGVSGDFNPIHYSDRMATAIGLPGVVAHGMLTMALAARIVTDLAGPQNVLEYGVRFTKPVLVPDDDTGATLEVSGTVKSVEDGVATIDVTAVAAGQKVLGRATAKVRLT